MSKPAGYIVRPKDMKALLDALGLRDDKAPCTTRPVPSSAGQNRNRHNFRP